MHQVSARSIVQRKDYAQELVRKSTFDVNDRKSLFCFSVYTENTGSTKPNYESQLLKMVKGGKYFSCDKADVYGDVEASLAEKGNYAAYDWTVKVAHTSRSCTMVRFDFYTFVLLQGVLVGEGGLSLF